MGKLSRRNFLKGAAVAGVVAVGGSSLAACGNTAAGTANEGGDSNITWEKEADIVILGTGAGGLSAARTAGEAGASVLILEKSNEDDSGGNTRVSGNMWNTPRDNAAVGVQYYIAASERDSDTEYLTALANAAVTLNDDFISKLPDANVGEFAAFSPEFPVLPGAEQVQSWQNGGSGNSQLWLSLKAGVDEVSGIEILYETPGKRLITNAEGEIIGLVAEQNGQEINVKARKGVILACGGYEFNSEMFENSYPGWPVYSRGTPYNTGDGILMAQKVGAKLWHMNASDSGVGAVLCPGLNYGHGAYDSDAVPANISLSRPSAATANASASIGFIALDKHGKRFVNEAREDSHGYGKREYLFFYDGVECEWPRIPFWTLFDEEQAQRGPVCSGAAEGRKFTWFTAHSEYAWSSDNSAEVEKGWIKKGNTIEELAQKIDVDPAGLAATLDKYNADAEAGTDTEFGRPGALMRPLTGPFYAMATYPNQYNTQGGPKRNTNAQTLDAFDEPIPRLYNVGELGAGYGWVYNGGWNNAEAMVTGIWAAKHAVALAPWDSASQ